MVSAGTLELLTFEAATLTLISTNAIPGTVGANTFTRPQPNHAQNRLQNRSRGACLPSATVPLRLFGGSAFFFCTLLHRVLLTDLQTFSYSLKKLKWKRSYRVSEEMFSSKRHNFVRFPSGSSFFRVNFHVISCRARS